MTCQSWITFFFIHPVLPSLYFNIVCRPSSTHALTLRLAPHSSITTNLLTLKCNRTKTQRKKTSRHILLMEIYDSSVYLSDTLLKFILGQSHLHQRPKFRTNYLPPLPPTLLLFQHLWNLSKEIVIRSKSFANEYWNITLQYCLPQNTRFDCIITYSTNQ